MGVPRDKNAKRFYQAAVRHLDEAELLLEWERRAGAIYLAGYCVECVLKALILVQTPPRSRADVMDSFRGSGAHNFDRLRSLYNHSGGAAFPKDVVGAFFVVDDWDTDRRYDPSLRRGDNADDFLAAVRVIWAYADQRL